MEIPSNDYRYDGPDYDPAKDNARLDKQLGRVYETMKDGKWKTLEEIAYATKDPQASISAQLRHLRKEKFGGYRIEKKRAYRNGGLFEYRLLPKVAVV